MAGNSRDNFNHKAVLGFSIVQLVSGFISVVFGICLIFFSPVVGFIGTGIWSGILFIIASIFGFTSWKYKNNGNIITLMVLSIISAVVAFSGLMTQVSSAIMNANGRYGYYNYYHYTSSPTTAVAMDSFLAIVFFVELVISIVCSAFCCKAVCCGQRSPAGQIVVYAQVQPNQQVMIPTSGFGGQPMGFVQAPVAPPAYFVSQNPTLTVVGAHGVENTHNSTEDEKGSQQDGGFDYGRLNNEC